MAVLVLVVFLLDLLMVSSSVLTNACCFPLRVLSSSVIIDIFFSDCGVSSIYILLIVVLY